ncbi:hypothetical protein Cob_v008171 [Colletotrichum orbiculare MAFF 240422]|uniref:Uncharacterized protein n=1 Tax=Colletotrichum orbiculare (strain 104-T / ATCC 96160 / CBS 514.97 / LARS 414 / MAFF 240422) TaxID=1213857 RepID=A0A484FME2_COLOR|nr:hypothetical protein Cob_v008171 [Colletotrichum orbiculare MAFF 240422]
MVFNSAVFPVNTLMSDHRVTVAAESFVRNADAFLPGASLLTERLSVSEPKNQGGYESEWSNTTQDFGGPIPDFQDLLSTSDTQPLLGDNASAVPTLSKNAARLSPSECYSIYAPQACAGLRDFQDVFIITRGDGWKRSDLWNLSDAADELWEPIVPRNKTNSLWSSTQCEMHGKADNRRTSVCRSSCNGVLSFFEVKGSWAIDLRSWYTSPWNDTIYSSSGSEFGLRYSSASLQTRYNSTALEVLYCLAEPRASICAVALSRPLLLVVVISVSVKLLLCIVVVWKLGSEEPLVTLGDAIASFISAQSDGEADTGPLTQDFVRSSTKNKGHNVGYRLLRPMRWVYHRSTKASAIPPEVWNATSWALDIGIFLAGGCLIAQMGCGIPLRWIKLSAHEAKGLLSGFNIENSFILSVIVVNSPQLYISFWYMTYNSIITRLEMGREWALFSVKFRPLRVTRPRGQQTSTYRLQLPYKYSISLLVMSVILHWLVSNSLFVLITRGDYYSVGGFGFATDSVNFAADITIAMAVSSLPDAATFLTK